MFSEKKWEPMQVLMLGVLVTLSLCGGILLAAVANQLAKPYVTHSNASLMTLIITALSFQGASIAWVHFFLLRHEVTWGEAFGFARRNAGRCILVALASLPLIFAGVLALSFLSKYVLQLLAAYWHMDWLKPKPQVAVELLRQQWPAFLIVLQGLVTVVLAPIAEEILFRGILYTVIKQRGHAIAAASLSSVLFALIHFYPVGFLSLIFLSIALIVAYEWTKNLLAPILIHALFNAINFAVIVGDPKWAHKLFNS
jgi:membrane protease YdiL (CAAX protease family)